MPPSRPAGKDAPSLARLHSELRLVPPRLAWAKLELFGGLGAVVAGLFAGFRALLSPALDPLRIVIAGLLAAAGAYLALAGHRSHLYRSNNPLAAHLLARLDERQG